MRTTSREELLLKEVNVKYQVTVKRLTPTEVIVSEHVFNKELPSDLDGLKMAVKYLNKLVKYFVGRKRK